MFFFGVLSSLLKKVLQFELVERTSILESGTVGLGIVIVIVMSGTNLTWSVVYLAANYIVPS
jgi:hypothetical protein